MDKHKIKIVIEFRYLGTQIYASYTESGAATYEASGKKNIKAVNSSFVVFSRGNSLFNKHSYPRSSTFSWPLDMTHNGGKKIDQMILKEL